MTTTVILFRDNEGWTLARYKGDTVPNMGFPTAKAARAYARGCGWNVCRAYDCDA